MRDSIDPIFNPASLAVVGVSSKPEKWGHFIAQHALIGIEQRACYLVNTAGGEVLGQTAYTDLTQLPEVPEFVALAVPALYCEDVIDTALDMGCKAFMIVAGGFAETDKKGEALQARIVSKIKAKGARLFGPNCIGLHDADACFHVGRILYPVGNIGLVSQSGVIAHDLSRYCVDHGLGFSRVINLGNQADVGLVESVYSFVGHSSTKALILYAEDLVEGRDFIQAAQAVVQSGIPVILLTIGESQAAIRSAASHTGALVSNIRVVDAACRLAGIHRVSTTDAAFNMAVCHDMFQIKPSGQRVGILSDGGGLATLAAETLGKTGFEVPNFSPKLQQRLRLVSGSRTITQNPVDLAGEADQNLKIYSDVCREILNSGEVDTVFFSGCLGYYDTKVESFAQVEHQVARDMAEASQNSKCALVVHTLYPISKTTDLFRQGGVPVFRDMSSAAESLHAVCASNLPDNMHKICAFPDPCANHSSLPTDYWSLRSQLSKEGISFPQAIRYTSANSPADIVDLLGFPIIVKAANLLHKSDAGGVVGNIRTEKSLQETLKFMSKKFGSHTLCIEQEAPVLQGIELFAGIKNDLKFGPVITVGFGGIHVEIFNQIAVTLAPVNLRQIKELIFSLPGSQLLHSRRDSKTFDIDGAARLILRLSEIAFDHLHNLDSIEINPILVLEDTVLALDARVILIGDQDNE